MSYRPPRSNRTGKFLVVLSKLCTCGHRRGEHNAHGKCLGTALDLRYRQGTKWCPCENFKPAKGDSK